MVVNGINGSSTAAGQMQKPQTNDSVSRNIQNQIANAQKQLQELSSNTELSVEEKMKKRQEIQKQIFELQNQLRQHEMELQKEARQAQSVSMEEMLGRTKRTEQVKEDGQESGLSTAGMEAMISADSAMNQAEAQGSIATRLEDKAGILEGEIKSDASRGASVEAKQGELADIEQRAMKASAAQISSLGNAAEEMKEAAKENEAGASGNQADEVQNGNSSQGEKSEKNAAETELSEQDAGVSMAVKYHPIDVLL